MKEVGRAGRLIYCSKYNIVTLRKPEFYGKLLEQMRQIVCIIFVLAFWTGNIFSVPEEKTLQFEHLSSAQGLSQNSVTGGILQDSKGFMWFATRGGLNKYDGYTFTMYRHHPGKPGALGCNYITALCEDRWGVLWVGTEEAGFYKFNREKETFTGYDHDPANPHSLSHNCVSRILSQRSGLLWITTLGGGLNKFDPQTETFTHYRHDPGNPHSLSSDYVSSICEDQRGMLWIGTWGAGPGRFDPQTETFTAYPHPDKTVDSSLKQIETIYEDGPDRLWIGAFGGGLILFEPLEERFTRYRSEPGNPGSLNDDNIYSIYRDRSGLLWVGGSAGGINIGDEKKEKFTHYRKIPGDMAGLQRHIILSIYEDRSGILWFGTGFRGLKKWARKENKWSHYFYEEGNPNSLSSSIVMNICEDDAGALWIGTARGLNKFDREKEIFTPYLHEKDNPNSLSHNFVTTIFEEQPGTLWIGTAEGLNRFDTRKEIFTVYKHDPGNPAGLASSFIYTIYRDKSTAFWIGTRGGGINKFEPGKERFIPYVYNPGDPGSLGHNDVFCIYEDTSGSFWVATDGGGLNRFDRETGTFTRYTTKEGLPDDVVYGILEDPRGNLWLSTNRGISRFTPATGTFKNYYPRSGVQDYEFNAGAFYKSRSGEMFFGGHTGFNSFFPEKIEDNSHVPPVVITAFKLFNQPVGIGGDSPLQKSISETKEIRLSFRQNIFSFEFAALDYTAPAQNQYKYKMEGLHSHWIYLGCKRDITFTGLEPGEYVFRVKGSNNDGIWNNEGTSIKIVITPPFWKTLWFRVAAILIISALFFTWHRARIKNLTLKLKTEAQLARLFEKYGISGREQEIVHLILKGRTNKEIEDALYISLNTVKTHVYNIFQKVGVKNRLELINSLQKSLKG